MLISREKKLVFVHIQKTAGMSFSSELKDKVPDVEEVFRLHAPAVEAIDLLGNQWDQFYKVAFVRNPWDRLVSWYSMIAQSGKRRSRLKQFGSRLRGRFRCPHPPNPDTRKEAP